MDWRFLFLEFEGRIPRRLFWLGFAMVMAAGLLIGLIPVIGGVLGVFLFWPQAAIHAKRLHDMGWSAWTLLAPVAANLLAGGAIMAEGPPPVRAPGVITPALATFTQTIGGALHVLALTVALEIGFVLWVGLTPTRRGPNRFDAGPDTDLAA